MIRHKSWWIGGLIAAGFVLAIVAAAAHFGAAQTGAQRSSLPQAAAASPWVSASPTETIPTPQTYMGVGSCTATACHGGKLESGASSNSAYTAWVTQDRHAKAFSVLRSSRSLAIVRALESHHTSLKIADPKPWTDARCLACHSIPIVNPTPNDALLVDGVSCEACHGPAGKWLAPHTTSGWSSLSATEKEQFGMRNTTEIVHRVKLCVTCHVGDPHSTNGVARDVNHDLIAAGHPRLNFEFATFAAQMPAHWSLPERVSPDGQRSRNRNIAPVKNVEARNWAVGQVVAAEADVWMREAHRSKGLDFADYDCYACHHQLQDKGAERFLQELGDSPSKKPKRGGLQPSIWYTTNLGLLSDLVHPEAKGLYDGFLNRTVDEKTTVPVSDLANVARSIGIKVEGKDANELRTLMAHVAAQGAKATTWDGATQHYLALVALNHSREGLVKPGSVRSAYDENVTDRLKGLYGSLKFPKSWKDANDHTQYGTKAPDNTKAADLDSPATFDPLEWSKQMKLLTDLLNKPPK